MRRHVLPLILALMLAATPAAADIVNTLRLDHSEEPGWSGGLSGSYSSESGNTEETSFKASASLQYRVNSHLFRVLGNGKRTSSAGEETARSVMGHLRHNHRIDERWSTLSFFQLQENPFQRLELRRLFGVGMRHDLIRANGQGLALGGAYMWEREQVEGVDGADSRQRLSLFLVLQFPLRPGVDIQAQAFYQPDVADFADQRTLVKANLEVDLTGSVGLFTGFQMEHDSRPPEGVEKTDWETSTGFSVTF